MESNKAKDLGPNNTVGAKRENSETNKRENSDTNKREHPDTNNCSTSRLVYVRRKIDHEQNKDKPSNEILKNSGVEKEKLPTSEPDLDLECHETNLDSDLGELKVITPSGVKNKGNSNLGSNGSKNELKLDSENTNGPKLDSENTNDPKLDVSTTHLSPIENKLDVTNINEDESNLGLDAKKNEHKHDAENITEPKLDSDLHDLNSQAGASNIDSNQEKYDINLAPNQNKCNMGYRERYNKLQIFLKDVDRSNQEGYIRMLRSLTAVDRSKHALDLENRAMNLLMEEAKELRRMSYLNVLGREKDNASVSTQNDNHK